MIKLDDALANITRLGIDTAPIIYFVEANPKYDSLMCEIFERIEKNAFSGVTSTISLLEVLVQPIRQGNLRLQNEYRDLFTGSEHFQTFAVSPNIAELAAELRARYNMRTPDALQIASAISVGCEAFLTNDIRIKRVTELRILILDELESH